MPVLYGAKGGSSTTSDLYTIDPVTGVASSVGPIGFGITGLAFDPTTGVLYGVTNNNSAAHPKSIVTIDPVTGAGTFVGALGLGSDNSSDICFDSTGQMYGWSTQIAKFIQIDKVTGAGTLVGIGENSGSVSCDTSDALYHIPFTDGRDITLVDKVTGGRTFVSVLGAGPGANGPNACAFDAADVLYALWNINPTVHLVTIDVATGVVTDIAATDNLMDGLAWGTVPVVPETNTSGGVRVGIAFNDVTLEPDPTFTYLTDQPNVVAGYEISRGGESEFEHTNPSQVTVKVNDQDGLLDPTNSSGPYYGLIEPLLQIIIQLWNPVAEEWQTRFRGFIEDYDYDVAPFAYQNEDGDTVGVTRMTIGCIDLEPILVAIEMQPGVFGDTPPAAAIDTVFFDNAAAHDRITQVLGNAGIPTDFYVVFSLNVNMPESVYSAGSNVMEPINDAVDAEFPTVSNRYVDRFGRLAVHGRLAKFDPDGTASDAGPDAWDFTRWKAGDGKAVAASPSDTAHLRTFAFNRGLSKIYNSALCTPNGIDTDPVATPLADQLATDAPSIALNGIRSWSSENLLIGAPTGDPLTAANAGTLTGNNALDETKAVADFIVANYAEPRNRITGVTFRSMPPTQEGAGANWDLLCRIDISDVVEITVDIPGGGGLSLEPFFVEGITESCEPLNGEYANVTLTPSLSPLAYFTDPAGLDGV